MSSAGVCASKDALLPYRTSRGEAPSSAPLAYCTSFRHRTCCSAEHAAAARLSVLHLAQGGASEACVEAWSRLACAVCHPRFGVDAGAPVCQSFCDDQLDAACRDDFFAVDAATSALTPCRAHRDVVCARLHEAAPGGGAEACTLAGFTPMPASSGWCFDGREPANAAVQRSSSRSHRSSPSLGHWMHAALRRHELPLAALLAALAALLWLHLRRVVTWSRRSSSLRESVLRVRAYCAIVHAARLTSSHRRPSNASLMPNGADEPN